MSHFSQNEINKLALNTFNNLKYYSPQLQYDNTAKTYHLAGCNVKLCLKFERSNELANNEDNVLNNSLGNPNEQNKVQTLFYFCTGDFFGISLAELLVTKFNEEVIDNNVVNNNLNNNIEKLKSLGIRSTMLVNEYWNRFIEEINKQNNLN